MQNLAVSDWGRGLGVLDIRSWPQYSLEQFKRMYSINLDSIWVKNYNLQSDHKAFCGAGTLYALGDGDVHKFGLS